MDFEYDPAKSKSNRAKHKIDFEEAKELWEDEDRLVIPARSAIEQRLALLAQRREKVWIAFFTLRDTTIRIISVRRARDNERDLYESGRA